MDNSSADGSSDGDSLEVRARQNVVLCILGLFLNSMLILIIGISTRMRKSAKYQLIVSLSLADMLVGLVYLPLDTMTAVQGGVWEHGCGLLLFTHGLQEFAMPAVAAFTLSALCIEYSVTVFFNVTPVMRRRVVSLGVVLPWALGLTALIPVFVTRFVTSSTRFVPPCTGNTWHISVLMVIMGMYGYLPLTFIVGCVLLMLVSFCCRPCEERMAVRTIISNSQGVYLTHELGDTLFACITSLALNLPFLVELTMYMECRGGFCSQPRRVNHLLEVLRTAESVFFPAIWLLGMEFRHGLLTSCNCCYRYCDLEVEQALT